MIIFWYCLLILELVFQRDVQPLLFTFICIVDRNDTTVCKQIPFTKNERKKQTKHTHLSSSENPP